MSTTVPIHQAIPTGTVTFLFTDIEGSTKRWEEQHEAMGAALSRHDVILRSAIEQHGGYIFKTMGDAFCAAFSSPHSALNAALAAQRSLHQVEWPQEIGVLKVRMAVHTGAVDEQGGDYFGQPVNRVARLLSAGHGGQVLLSHSTHDLVRDSLPAGITLLDLGEHRLKDLIRPEHIFQAVAPDLPSEFPPLNTQESQKPKISRSNNLNNFRNLSNLPLQLTSFIGREREIAEVKRLLSTSRLLTLTGAGGSGKTRLALQVASQVLDQFPDGVFFINLAPVTEPNLVVSAIAQTLDVKEAVGQPLIETLKAHLQDKEMLLVLDNFEQVREAAPILNELLLATTYLKVLVTSQAALHLYGDQQYQVPPLQVPETGQKLPPLEQLTQYEAVYLFIERARSAKADFALTNDNAQAVVKICHRLDGLPLAIELAAARIRLMPPQAMLTHLQSRLKLLTKGAMDSPARQQTLRAAIEWSHDLLHEEEKKLFRRLAIFAGGCTLEAAEVVCSPQGGTSTASVPPLEIDLLDGLSALVDKNLIRQQEPVAGEFRFVMLETIHEYARERLEESGELDTMHQQHAYLFLHMAEQIESQLKGSESRALLKRLEAEHDNLRAALLWSWQAGNHTDVALRLVGALSRFWSLRGYYTEGREMFGRVLSRENMSDAPVADETVKVAKAKALVGAASLTYHQDDYLAARSLAEESLALHRDLEDKHGIAQSLNILGNIAHAQGHYAEARQKYEESLSIRKELGNRRSIAQSLANLGAVLNAAGDYTSARVFLEESLPIYTSLDAEGGVAFSLLCLGEAARGEGNIAQARALFEKSLAISRGLDDKHSVSVALHNLGHVIFRQGDLRGAEALFTEGLVLSNELGIKTVIAWCLAGLASVAGALGYPARAAQLFGATEAVLEVINSRLEAADRMEYDRNVATAQAQLDQHDWQVAWEKGRAMVLQEQSMERAIAYALEETPETKPAARPPSASVITYPNGLTHREVEVLRLLVEGLSNEQIAERLFLSTNTVRAHLYSIYSKLGVPTRAAATRFAVEHQLI